MKRLRVACLQMNASEDLDDNLLHATAWIRKAARQKAKFIALPENFLWRGPSRDLNRIASQLPRILRHFQMLAAQTRASILLGSVIEKSSHKEKYFNTSILVSDTGKLIARYRKIHLFKVGLKQVQTDESRHIQAGTKSVVGKIGKISVGLTVCYDLRFPELFRQLTFCGAELIAVPSNFTEYTGKAHWEVLLRARAIENQIFIVAPGQVGVHPSSKIRSFGTSMIIDPWGTVLAKGSQTKEELLIQELDFSHQRLLRRSFPVLSHCIIKS